jgi:hypothetical protein
VGDVLSKITEELFVVELTKSPSTLLVFLKPLMEIATLPSEVELVAVYVADQLVPLPLTVADCPAIVTKGAVID